MKKLLLATHNQAKLEELIKGTKILNKKIKITSLKDFNIKHEPEETGKTFKENAILKAQYYANLTKVPTIADDGGLEIEILNNEPGVNSHRWPGYKATDQELIDYTLKRLNGLPKTKRTAYLRVCVCFYDPKSKIHLCEEEKIKGYVSEKGTQKPTNGYPYRSLFVVSKFNCFYDKLTNEQHRQTNHRLIALKRLVNKASKYLIK